MGSPVVGQRRDGEASIVAARDTLFRVEAFPIMHAEKGPGDRGAMTATDIKRASTPETGLIVEDELVVREPRWAEGFDRRGVDSPSSFDTRAAQFSSSRLRASNGESRARGETVKGQAAADQRQLTRADLH